MHRRWTTKCVDASVSEEFALALGLSSLAASVLAVRDFSTADQAGKFLSPSLSDLPDPNLIAGMEAAAARLARAVEAGETVWVYTDYDVDGVSCAALFLDFFKQNNTPCQVRLPRRDREGYGLHSEPLREIAARGATLVVTADCGITSVEEARLARELGIDLVITDHHTPGPTLPDAAAVVNPKLPGSEYPDASIAGVGVAWNLAAAVRRKLRESGRYTKFQEPDLRGLLDFVALGTVADVVPLKDVNRIFVVHGLKQLNSFPRPGITALGKVAGLKGDIKAGHIGFQLGPRLNAAGRMTDPLDALALLSSGDPSEALKKANFLDELNGRRREEELSILNQCLARIEKENWHPGRWSLVVESNDWHKGVVGIVASRLAERCHRPAIVLTVEGGEAKGSARSIAGLDIHSALAECAELLTRFGGHASAAGLSLETDMIPKFREALESAVHSRLREEDLIPRLSLDAEARFSELSPDAVRELAMFEPFGFGNPSPLFLTKNATVLDVKIIGSQAQHMKLRVESMGLRMDVVAWRKAESLGYLRAGMNVDLAYCPQINEWGGRENVQLVLEGVRPCDA